MKLITIEHSKKLIVFEGETIIKVYSSLGSYCGEFVWPTKSLSMLTKLNKTNTGYFFRPQKTKHGKT